MDVDTLLRERIMVSKNGQKRMSTLLFWQGRKGASSPSGRNWIHQPDLLVKGHVVYLVKFLGSTTVDQPKGIEVVKDAIKKLNFNQQLKAKENAKCKKVEITISVDGVAIQEPRTNNILHQFPLHRISYCADDKGAKKYFSFIAKGAPETNGMSNGSANEEEHHECFVFVSTKLAAEITLTIGQAFDLAYRRFLKDSDKFIELQKLQLTNKKLELQVNAYRTRLQDLARLVYKDDLQGYLTGQKLSDVSEFKIPSELSAQLAAINDNNTSDLGLDVSSSLNSTDANSTHESNNLLLDTSLNFSNHTSDAPSKNPVVGPRLEELLLNSDSDSDFDPRASESDPPAMRVAQRNATSRNVTPDVAPPPLLAPPPKTSKRQNGFQQTPTANQNGASDLFGSAPFAIPPQPIVAPSTLTAYSQSFNSQTNPMNGQSPLNGQTMYMNGQNTLNGQNSKMNGQSPFASSGPNYDIGDFNMASSVFNTANTFTNGLTDYDPFDTRSNTIINGNGYSGFGGLSEKPSVPLNSSFSGFLDKRINEMKDGFNRGITFGNDDFNIDHLDPLKKN